MPEIYALSQSERNPDQQNRAIRAALERLRGLETMHALAAVKCATTANITLSGTQTIDTISAGVSDRVLVKDQTAPAENGVYVVAAGAWTRSTDMDSWDEVPQATVSVEQGSANPPGSKWVCVSSAGGTIDVTDIVWEQTETGLIDGVITNAKLADMPANTIKGSIAGGAPDDLTASEGRQVLGLSYGLQTIWVPAAGMVGYVGAAPSQSTYSSGNFHALVYDFDQTTIEAAVFQIAMPKSWDKGNIFFVPYWTASGSPSGTAAWALYAYAISDNEALSVTLTNLAYTTDTFQNADRLHIGPLSSSVTPDNSPANDDLVLFEIARDPNNDTLTADARLIGIKILYTVSAGNDS